MFARFNGKCPDLSEIDIITIAHGTNDLSSNVPIGEIGNVNDISFNTNTFYGAYRSIINTIQANYPNIRIMLCTPIHKHTSEACDVTPNAEGHYLKDYVEAIRNIGEMYSLQVCDFYKECGLNYNNYLSFYPDGVHPNEAGYKLMGKTYIENLKKIGFAEAKENEIVKVEGVTISKTEATIGKGNTLQLTKTITPSNATNTNVSWESSDSSIATVTNVGLVKGIKEGNCTITVKTIDGDFTASCNLTIEASNNDVLFEKVSRGLVVDVDMATGTSGDSTINDLSGNNNNLTISQQPSSGGFTGKSFIFNDNDKSVYFSKTDFSLNTSTGTLEWTVRPLGTSGMGFNDRTCGLTGVGGAGLYSWIGRNNLVVFRNNSSLIDTSTSGFNIAPNNIYHFVVTFSNTDVKVYINGELRKTIEGTYNTNFNFGELLLGDIIKNSSSKVKQELFSSRLYSVALSESEVLQNYNYENSIDRNY